MPSDRNPDHLYPVFRGKFQRVLEQMQEYLDVHHKGLSCKLIEGFRTAAYQQELYAIGRTAPGKVVTWRDGVNHRSDHQSSLAADVGFFDGAGHYLDGDEHPDAPHDCWEYYGHLCRQQGLEWGGSWHRPDEPHAQWPEFDHQTYESARLWQRSQGLA